MGSMRTSDGSRCLVGGEEYYVRRCDTADWKERGPGRYFVFRSNVNIEYKNKKYRLTRGYRRNRIVVRVESREVPWLTERDAGLNLGTNISFRGRL